MYLDLKSWTGWDIDEVFRAWGTEESGFVILIN